MATKGFAARQAVRDYDAATANDFANYNAQLQRATWASLGPEFSQGLGRIQGWAAGAGPLADSGAPTALRMRLGSDIYGRAAAGIQRGSSDFLRQMLEQRRAYIQGIYGQKFQRDIQPSGAGQFAGQALGTVGGAALGHYLPQRVEYRGY